MPKQKSVMLYLDTESVLEPLSLEDVGRVFLSIFQYLREREVPKDLSIGAQVAFRSIKNFLDRDIEKYENTCQRNLENGKKGGRPKKENLLNEEDSQKTQVVFEKPYNNNNSSNNNSNSSSNSSKNNMLLLEEEEGSSPPSSPPPLSEDERAELAELGIPLSYAEERRERAEHFAKFQKKRVIEILSDWWETDRHRTPPNQRPSAAPPPPSEHKSYDLDEFWEAALRRSEEELEKLAAQDRLRHK